MLAEGIVFLILAFLVWQPGHRPIDVEMLDQVGFKNINRLLCYILNCLE